MTEAEQGEGWSSRRISSAGEAGIVMRGTTTRSRHYRKKPVRKLSLTVLILVMLTAAAFIMMLTVVDAFPADLMAMILGLMAVLFIASAILLFRERKWLRIAGIVFAAVFIAIYGAGTYYMANTYAMFNKISDESEAAAKTAEGFDITRDAFNVYITGIDQWKKEKGLDLERSDVNMIITVCPVTRKILLTSIPRDAYITLHRTGTMDKLTHTGIYGVDETLSSVEDWTGLSMNYYVKANFTGFVSLVHAIGGIDIYNPYEFTSALTGHTYPKGNIHLKSYGALYYARERKAFEGEDQLRVRNQLIVVEAILDKIMSSETLLTKYGKIMKALGEEVTTNMPSDDIEALIKMQLSDMSKWDVQSQRMSGEYDMEIVASMDPSNEYQVLKVSPQSFLSCLEQIKATMNPTEEELAAIQAAKKEEQKQSFVQEVLSKFGIGGGGSEEEGEAGEEQE